ncbi:MAG: hypothetical protein ACI8TS_002287, partial [Flavobacteriales bacterium]
MRHFLSDFFVLFNSEVVQKWIKNQGSVFSPAEDKTV